MDKTKATLTLVYDLATGHLAMSGEVPHVDVALNMLAQATREYEAQYREQRVLLMRQQLQEQEQNKQIANMIRNRA